MLSSYSSSSRLHRVFVEGFTAMDVAEPLVSFDFATDGLEVKQFMEDHDFDLVGVRKDGLVSGYVRREELGPGGCGTHMREFIEGDDLVPESASLTEVVNSLAINAQCFVIILDQVGGIVTLSDLEKPPMRMFLFGIITIGEMLMSILIKSRYPDDAWKPLVSPQRLTKAIELREERKRRGQIVGLLDCLQYGDKGWILGQDEEVRSSLGLASRREARRTIKELENLRNNLAHTQEIIPTGWSRIVFVCSRIEQNLSVLANNPQLMQPRQLDAPDGSPGGPATTTRR